MEYRVAGVLRVIRRYLNPIYKRGICIIDLITPESSLVVTSVYVNRRIIRVGNSEVQLVEISNVTGYRIKDRVSSGTRSPKCITQTRLLMNPNIRIFLIRMRILSRVNSTNSYMFRSFFNNAQDMNRIATFRFTIRYRVEIGVSMCDLRVLAPTECLAFM